MIFTGKLFGFDFADTEVDSHVGLIQNIQEGDRDQIRCWVLVFSKKGTYWLELVVDDNTLFLLLVANNQLALDEKGRVLMEIRRKPCRSPEGDDDLGRSLPATITCSTFESPKTEYYGGVITFSNELDPFTRSARAFVDLECPLVSTRRCDGRECCFCGQSSFVRQAENISGVELADGTTKDLVLDWRVWVKSVLPASKELRGSYFNVNVGEKARDAQLRRIKEKNKDLWLRITYWIADLGDSDALKQIEMPTKPNVPPCKSPFYFSPEEAIDLGELSGPSFISLGEALRAKSSTSTCAAHELKPFLEKVFGLEPGFHKAAGFLDEKKAWTKNRKQLMSTKEGPEKAPMFGSFGGIR